MSETLRDLVVSLSLSGNKRRKGKKPCGTSVLAQSKQPLITK